MKKILLGLIIISAISFAEESVVPKDSGKLFNFYGLVGASAVQYNSWLERNKENVPINYTTGTADGQNPMGFNFDIQATYNVSQNNELGLGVGYRLNPKRVSEYWDNPKETRRYASYNSVPIYAVWRYNFRTESKITPYIIAKIGYSINALKDDATKNEQPNSTFKDFYSMENGGFFGVGLGIEYNNFIVEFVYAQNSAWYNYDDKKGTPNSTQRYDMGFIAYDMTIGYKFSL
ncbi:MAG: hypothetical protein ACRC0V_04695 [Fusobacteriaceae bacterium]